MKDPIADLGSDDRFIIEPIFGFAVARLHSIRRPLDRDHDPWIESEAMLLPFYHELGESLAISEEIEVYEKSDLLDIAKSIGLSERDVLPRIIGVLPSWPGTFSVQGRGKDNHFVKLGITVAGDATTKQHWIDRLANL